MMVRRHTGIFKYLNDDFRCDKDIALAAMRLEGCALRHAGADLQADIDVALAVAAQDYNALWYVAHSLWADREFVMQIIQRYCGMLTYISNELQHDREVVLAAAVHGGQLSAPQRTGVPRTLYLKTTLLQPDT